MPAMYSYCLIAITTFETSGDCQAKRSVETKRICAAAENCRETEVAFRQ